MAKAIAPKDDRRANRRGAARLAAVQALYQMDLASTSLDDILAEFEAHWIGREVEGEQYLPAEAAFFREVVSGVVAEQRKLDPLIDAALARGWPLKRIETVLRAILRAGAYELDHRRDVPARVVVSEYVDVAHAFVDADETGNGQRRARPAGAANTRRRIRARDGLDAMAKSPSDKQSGEDRLIARYFKPLARHPGAFGLDDDAAILSPPARPRRGAQDRRHCRRHAFLSE